jgi:hypothetical protein
MVEADLHCTDPHTHRRIANVCCVRTSPEPSLSGSKLHCQYFHSLLRQFYWYAQDPLSSPHQSNRGSRRDLAKSHFRLLWSCIKLCIILVAATEQELPWILPNIRKVDSRQNLYPRRFLCCMGRAYRNAEYYGTHYSSLQRRNVLLRGWFQLVLGYVRGTESQQSS